MVKVNDFLGSGYAELGSNNDLFFHVGKERALSLDTGRVFGKLRTDWWWSDFKGCRKYCGGEFSRFIKAEPTLSLATSGRFIFNDFSEAGMGCRLA